LVAAFEAMESLKERFVDGEGTPSCCVGRICRSELGSSV